MNDSLDYFSFCTLYCSNLKMDSIYIFFYMGCVLFTGLIHWIFLPQLCLFIPGLGLALRMPCISVALCSASLWTLPMAPTVATHRASTVWAISVHIPANSVCTLYGKFLHLCRGILKFFSCFLGFYLFFGYLQDQRPSRLLRHALLF